MEWLLKEIGDELEKFMTLFESQNKLL